MNRIWWKLILVSRPAVHVSFNLICILLIFLIDEIMIQHFHDCDSIFGILVQTLSDEIFRIVTNRNVFREINLFLDLNSWVETYHFLQIIFASDLERNSTVQQFICQNTDVPDVYFTVVLFLLNQLWRSVDRCPT